MQDKRILEETLCLGTGVVESVRKEIGGTIVASCRPRKGQSNICPHCGRHRPVYDCSPSPRRWRTMDQGPVMAFVEYATVRVECPEHGVVVAAVPWAEHASRFTREFEQQVAWLAMQVLQDRHGRAHAHRLGERRRHMQARLRRARRRGRGPLRRPGPHRHRRDFVQEGPQVHDGRARPRRQPRGLVREGAREGRAQALLRAAQRGSEGQHTGGDGRRRALDSGARGVLLPQRREGHGPLPRRELDDRRRRRAAQAGLEEGPAAERRGELAAGGAKAVKGSRYALLKNPEDLTEAQGESLERVAREDKPLYRAYLLKERLRDVFKAGSGAEARLRLESWLASACRTRIDEVKELSKKVRRHKDAIVRAVELGISNARVEAINNKIKLTVRMAYGFRNFDNLVALVMLRCSNLPIALPGR